MLHGYGNQKFLKKSYLEDRRKALLDRSKYNEEDLEELEIIEDEGSGRTNPTNTIIKQFPYPVDSTVRSKQKVDIRKIDPTLGEMSD